MARPAQLDDHAWLSAEYETEGRSSYDLADELGCDPWTVRKALARLGIPLRPAGRRRADMRLYDRAWLDTEYTANRRSCIEIAGQLGCDEASVITALRNLGIDRRKAARRPVAALEDIAELRRLYVTEAMSTVAIGKKLSCSTAAVNRALTAAGIPRRAKGGAGGASGTRAA